ncbi:MAG: hypothetical protein JXA77_13735 [Bacteroidales bacterium]|nr:hypothetical protein [Bacteroidales bacterium]MBN2819163.1 hypothetical protein [Bacteroidales bacterium]
MAEYIIYLLETGVCLALFYVGYILLFRKETYFAFVRYYLICSMVLALVIPLIHIDLASDNALRRKIESIHRYKSYYEEVVLLTDAEFDLEDQLAAGEEMVNKNLENKTLGAPLVSADKNKLNRVQLIFFLVYAAGVLFFFARFLYLLIWLNGFSKKNKKENIDGLKLVTLDKEMPSFSFFNRIFINRNILTASQFEQVFAHEKIHANQKHSFDLLLAHVFTIFQWFNPLVWRMHKSMKIVHEYIADRKVVEQGYELFDYQSLLLSQLISIRSVELVNNFNLLSIKKRIAMMNKMKSGHMAKLKAIVAVPLVMLVFFVFSDLTFADSDVISGETNQPQISSIMPVNSWPLAKYYREIDMDRVSIIIWYDGSKMRLNEKFCNLQEFPVVLEEFLKENTANAGYHMVLFDIDKQVKMEDMYFIFKTLRENEVYKVAYRVMPESSNFDKSIVYAQPQMLPPIDAQIIKKDELRKEGVKLFEYKDVPASGIEDLKMDIEKLIQGSKKYIIEYEFSKETTYETYINNTNAVFQVFNKVRNFYTQENYNKKLDELESDVQEEVRKVFPITLMMVMAGEEILN